MKEQPKIEVKVSTKPTWQTHACFGRNCAEWAAGASHKCEIGRCKKFERALAEWEAAEGREEVK